LGRLKLQKSRLIETIELIGLDPEKLMAVKKKTNSTIIEGEAEVVDDKDEK
jgi:hypothetical protein